MSDEKREPPVPELIPIKEAARILCVNKYTLYYWAETRRIPHYKIGRRVMFARAELLAWLAARRVDGVA